MLYQLINFRCAFHVMSILGVHFIMSNSGVNVMSCHIKFRCVSFHVNFQCPFRVISISGVQYFTMSISGVHFMSCQFQVCISFHVNFRCIDIDIDMENLYLHVLPLHKQQYDAKKYIIFHHVHFRCKFHVMSITSVYIISCHIQLYISYHVNFRCVFHFLSI